MAQDLEHANKFYDPVKAHEYYLRIRKLHPRQHAQVKPTGQANPGATKRPTFSSGLPAKAATKTPEQQAKEIEDRVAALKNKLENLRKLLAALVRQAKSRSGVKQAPRKASSSGKTSSSGKKSASTRTKPLTGVQKAKARAASKKYARTHKTNSSTPASDQIKQLEQDIKHVEEEIAKARAKLKASVGRGRAAIQYSPASKPPQYSKKG